MVCLPTGTMEGASCVLSYQSGRRSRHPRAPSTGKASTLSCEFLLFSRTNSRALGRFYQNPEERGDEARRCPKRTCRSLATGPGRPRERLGPRSGDPQSSAVTLVPHRIPGPARGERVPAWRRAKRATHTFVGWSGPESIQEAHRDSDLRSGPPAVDARLASLIGIPSSRRGGAGRDWAGGARPTGRTAIILSKNARTWDLEGAGPTRGRVRSPRL